MIRILPRLYSFALLSVLLVSTIPANAYLVTELQASYSNGQVFLTWKNPTATNLRYNVYRSTSPLNASNINSSTYLGYVRDNSAKNSRKSQLYGSTYYFKINASAPPLASDRGLYVATCTNAGSYYYAVMVTDLNTGLEDKSVINASNSLSVPVSETVANPQPVLQLQGTETDGTLRFEYAMWGNNQNTSHFPAFNNAGSYAHNFTVFKLGNSTNKSIYVLFKDDSPFNTNGIYLCNDCNVLKIDDRLPNGVDSYWSGWNENYDMYSTTNPVATTGDVHMYTQVRLKETFEWVRKNIAADSNKLYVTGISHNGFGALLTSEMWPDLVAATYANKAPIIVKPINNSPREQQWSDNASNPNSDYIDPNTGIAIPLWKLFDFGHMNFVNRNNGLPFMSGINGKQDVTVGWIQKYFWYDSVNYYNQGGTWFWDNRTHTGTGETFTDTEVTPDYERFSLAHSYPAFSYCSINQDPGNGTPSNGAMIGALNGYLDWNNAGVVDISTNYDITCFVKDMYAGGVLMANQYDSCTTNITFRRLQQFKPQIGQVVTWSVRKNNGNVVQQGTFTYNGGPITLTGIKIYRVGSKISLSVPGCTTRYYADADNDTYGSSADAGTIYCSAPAGLVTNNLDCNDNNVAINPLAQEVCDANDIDEDCDGLSDDADNTTLGKTIYYLDADHDGFGAVTATGVLYCNPPAWYVTNKADCNDANNAIRPNAQEICDANDVDEDCDGMADDADPSATGKIIYYADADHDGFGTSAVAGIAYCNPPAWTVTSNTDCNDANAAINPSATEICDGNLVDEDCDGLTDASDPSVTGLQTYYMDADGDGYGSMTAPGNTFCTPPPGYVTSHTDCNDANAAIHPDATEICDGNNIDENCNGVADNADAGAIGKIIFYRDIDLDGFGDMVDAGTLYCDQPSATTSNHTDCNDANSSINPAANELCNANQLDEDCDGLTDDADPSAIGQQTYYIDADGDGFGSPGFPGTVYCVPPFGYAANNSDCNDGNSLVRPGTQEVCDVSSIDENCNGLADDADASANGKTTYYLDADNDGYGSATASGTAYCHPPAGLTTSHNDCADGNASINPAAADICDGIDNNCNGVVDENAITVAVSPAGPLTGCKSDVLTLTASGTNITSYKWYKGTNTNSVSGASSATYTLNYETNTIKAVVSNGFGCSATSNIVSLTGLLLPSSVLTVLNGGNLNICAGAVSFTATGGSNYSWQWYKNDVAIAGATTINYTALSNGTYTVKVTNTSGCYKLSNAVTVFGQATYYTDADLDGYGSSTATASLYCTPPAGMAANNTDCNDANSAIRPNAAEICDANDVDEDCDGMADDADPSVTGKSIYYADSDNDGFGSSAAAGMAFCNPPAGQVANNTDCNDANSAIRPDAVEICDVNNVDENCNGVADDADAAAAGKLTYYADADQDGYGTSSGTGTAYCHPPAGMVWSHTDCNDANAAINPAATEVCDAGNIDENCNGLSDNDDPSANGKLTYYADQDQDGFGSSADAGLAYCDPPAMVSLTNNDCNDNDATINPPAIEICDANDVDEDCDGMADDADPSATGKLVYYADDDHDAFGSSADAGSAYCNPPAWTVTSNTDCNDANAAINPSATEICDGNLVDEDCDGLADASDPSASGFLTYYMDADQDGYGSMADPGTQFCTPPPGYITSHTDCNDANAAIHPDATEICDANNIDENCNGVADDADAGAIGKTIFYRDIDLDGFGDISDAGSQYCDQPAGTSTNHTDCNDNNAAINPAASEICDANQLDEDCDGLSDNADPSATGLLSFYIDADNDGYGSAAANATLSCTLPFGYAANNNDCNDGNSSVRPGSQEVCDVSSIDENCNGLADDADASANGKTTYYLDADNDGYGSATASGTAYCHPPAGLTTSHNDCADGNASINPAAADICDGIDNNCNGVVDENAITVAVSPAGPLTGCKSDVLTLTASGTNITSYKWYKGTNTNSVSGASSATYTLNYETNTIKAVVSNGFGCSATSNIVSLTGLLLPSSVLTVLNGGNLNICAGAVSFTATGGSNYSWQWYKNDVAIAGATTINYTALSNGTYTVKVTNTSGCYKLSNAVTVFGQVTYYTDADLDGYGSSTATASLYCTPPAGMATNNTDCNDANSAIRPNAAEICDANDVDEDCDGMADDADPSVTGKSIYYADSDNDGFGSSAATGMAFCNPPAGQVANNTDCNDANSAIRPDAVEICDVNNVDENCNGVADDADAAAAGKLTYYADADQDGYGTSSGTGTAYCHPPAGMVWSHTDCNDANAAINPAATEVCDAGNIDENCNGLSDNDDPSADGKLTYYADQDQDGFGSSADAGLAYCDPPAMASLTNNDCNDNDATINPPAIEICDANDVDEDCDGMADDADPSATGKLVYYTDDDQDGFGSSADAGSAYCNPPAWTVTSNTDCNDANAAINPSATEICDAGNIDDDCNGLSDDADPVVIGKILYYTDADNDGYGSDTASGIAYCHPPMGMINNNDDCDDSNNAINPSVVEFPDNNIDDNCNGLTDIADSAIAILTLYYLDADWDGFGDATDTGLLLINQPTGRVADNTDCNDANSLINPASTEVCDANQIDENCNGLSDDADPGSTGKLTYFTDADQDGYGSANASGASYCQNPAGWVIDHTDCNDTEPAIHPGAIEICDVSSIDDDCNGLSDDADYAAAEKNIFYPDTDQDGYGSSSVAGIAYCHPPLNMTTDHADCNDGSAAVNPAATEICDINNVDEDCNGLADDSDLSASGKYLYYADSDNDGYGNSNATGVAYCDPPAYRSLDHTDCDDASAAINPGASEVCDANNVDENCNGLADDTDIFASGKLLYYTDADGDGYGAVAAIAVAYCDPPAFVVVNHTDCNDGNGVINPAAIEICDANDLDEDCDGLSDDADPSATGKILYYPDADFDGFGAASAAGSSWCNQPAGKVTNHTDCNDSNYAIKPGGTEVCDVNNLDEDCDGLTDDTDPSVTGKLNYYTDADNDGYGSSSSSAVPYCDPPLGKANNQSDCNDGNPAIHPLAPEFCDINDIDENCNGLADNNDPTAIGKVVYYVDADGDGFGSSTLPGVAYCTPPAGTVTSTGDCADNNAAIKPGISEICDGIDNNCNGLVDEGLNPSNPMPQPVITPVGSTSFCFDQSVTLNAPTGFNTYSWSNGKTGQSITANTAGNITVTVKDANNCYGTSAPLNLVVWEPATPTVTLTGPSTYCIETPSILSTIPGYYYQWKKGATILTGATNQTYAPTATNTAYKVTITDEHGCAKTSDNFSVTVNSASVPNITSGGSTTLCVGQSVTLTATAGYNSYLWSSGQTNPAITVSDAGSYTVAVIDQNGCSATSAAKTVVVNPLPTPVISAGGPLSFCDGGSVILDAGAGYVSYSWSNGKNTQTNTITASGTYSVTVTNSNSCSATSAPVTVTEWIPVVPTVSTSLGATTFCANTGVYLTTISGIAYQWSKSGTDITGATSQNYTPSSGGSYKVMVTDGNGCQATSAAFSITILSNPVPVISGPSVICNGSTITLSCGTYNNYLWSNGATTASINPGTAGDYTVTVTDANGCVGTSAVKTETVVPLPTPVITASGPIQFCDGGSVTLDAGAGYTTYSWSNSKSTQTNNITASGTFTVTVTNSNGCSGTSAPVTVDEWIPPTPVISTSNGATTFCASANVYLTTVGGYSYQWQKSLVDIVGATAQNYYPTSSGSYKVIITDNHGCSKTSAAFSITLLSNPVPVISGPSVICTGSTITLSCGTFSSYLWSTGATTASINPGLAGNYTVTVTDANGCIGTSAAKTETVVPLPTPVITASGPIQFCDGGNVTLDAGAGYTTYSWSNSKSTQTNNITASGTFTVTVTNSNGCSGTSAPVTVDEWIPPTPVISTSNGATTFCASANVYLTTVGGYSYQWQKSSVDIVGATAQNYYPTSSGSYKVIITDNHGCSKTSAAFSITLLSNPVPVISGPSVICTGSTITLSCGTFSSYLWSTGATTASINPGLAGNYTVTVTDANGCIGTSAAKTETVVPLPTPVITASGPIQFCDGGNVTLDAGAGYTTYSWSNSKSTQTNNITASGTFTVTVTNTNGCSGTSAPVTVDEWIPPTPVVTIVGPATFCVNNSTTYLTTLSGPYTYQWIKGSTDQAGATNQNYTPTATASYKVKITDIHSCSKTSSTVSITANSAPTASINISGSATICAGQTKTINANTGTGLTYQWKRDGNNISGATAASYAAGIAGNYTCVVTNSNGCSTTSNTITIIVNCKEDEGIATVENKVEWLMYPNPTNNELHIRLNMGSLENAQYEIEIRNMLGSVVWFNRSAFTDHVIAEDLSLNDMLAAGVYLVIVNVNNNLYHSEFLLTRK